ncbi:hypothetical protein PATSB16_32780 [Pandoraea thiooxydans]|nr:hypothetical protein PATSB16_32780 [Pandoraea thiooxydans]
MTVSESASCSAHYASLGISDGVARERGTCAQFWLRCVE